MREIFKKYIPEKALDYVLDLWKKYPLLEKYPYKLKIKIKPPRSTKLGDFKVLGARSFQITINNNLPKEQFLLTLIHEIAHMVTYIQYQNNVKPHGEEWQENFRILMYPLLNTAVFDMEILPYLFNYFKKPKASSCSDGDLYNALQKKSNGKKVFDMPEKSEFTFKNKRFKLLSKKRTRALCKELLTGQNYLISGHAIVESFNNQ